MNSPLTDNDFDLPDDEPTVYTCSICSRPFPTERLLSLHLGEIHPDECTPDQIQQYELAHGEESDDLFIYHLKVVTAVVVLLMGFSYLYAFVLA